MKRPDRALDGFYYIKSLGDVKAGKGKKFKELFGSREQVMNGTAYKTPGGLTVDDLIVNKHGRIVSKKKFYTAKKEKRLEKYGYFAKKGKFGYVKKGANRTTVKMRKMQKAGEPVNNIDANNSVELH
jgi:hypothetical protein